jgi:glycosyltransferase involved in cell wall biosynthesis
MIDLVFVGHRCCDHSPSSGYDQVCSLFPEAGWLDGRSLEAGRLEWQREPQEPASMAHALFHVIYGDCSGKALPEILRRRFPEARIVSSAHQPVARLRADLPAIDALKASDAIITVSSAQGSDLADYGLAAPIYSIPHGVWTRVFRPASTPSGPVRRSVLLVGSFLRDWEGAKQVVGVLARAGVRSIALGAGAHANLVGNGSLLEVPPRVSEAELAELYQHSAAVFLPLLDATASNALLEAMAAGCPVVCPRLGPLVEEYLDDDSDAYEAGRYDLAAARLLHYVCNPAAREAKARQLMKRAGEFDWARIKQRYAAVYQEVAAA